MKRLIALGCALLAVAAVHLAGASHTVAAPDPLSDKVIVLDPGHQLGNSNPRFAKYMAQSKFNGSITKGCNTSGTATNAGFPEATFNWRVANSLKAMLEKRGATVVMTRDTNSRDDWGPCTWDRAGVGNKAKADAMISIHANGAPSSQRGFFAIVPTSIKGWTDDVARADAVLARKMTRGMVDAGAIPDEGFRDYTMVSPIMTTLNFSNVPTTIVELGNMRNAADARLMSSRSGQQQYAQWLLAGLEKYFAK